MRCVLDASVIVKWLVRDPVEEAQTEEALSLMEAVARGDVDVVQPPHWLAEVTAVMTRLSPATAATDTIDLHALDFEVADDLAVYRRAVDLAIGLGQHVFDTLYHAVALERTGCTLVTADLRYLAKARTRGRIVELANWRASH